MSSLAAGGPVAVDTETILCPRAEGVGGAGEFSVDYGEIFPEYRMSVGESMILPRFYGKGQTSPLLLEGRYDPESFESTFIESFAEGYRNICIMKDQIVEILNRYKDTTLRYLLRSTQSYVINVWRYKLARNDEEREKALIPGYLIMSPVDYACHRLDMMSERDLAVQISYIRASLKHIDYWDKTEKPEEDDKSADVQALSAEEAVEEVQLALDNLWAEKIVLSDGCCLWHAPFVKGRAGSLFGIGEGFSGQ